MEKTNEQYSDWQMVCEIVTFTEPKLDGDVDRAIALCKERFKQAPGPPGWKAPDDEQLKEWIQEFFDNLKSNQ